jgi:hypothetical protein
MGPILLGALCPRTLHEGQLDIDLRVSGQELGDDREGHAGALTSRNQTYRELAGGERPTVALMAHNCDALLDAQANVFVTFLQIDVDHFRVRCVAIVADFRLLPRALTSHGIARAHSASHLGEEPCISPTPVPYAHKSFTDQQ